VPTITVDEDDVAHGHWSGGASAVAARITNPVSRRSELAQVRIDAHRAAPGQEGLSPAPSQARLDTRPKGGSETEAVVRESPLPATGGPSGWVSALAAVGAAASAGGSGIAAILAALVLMPPLLRRVRDGAVVRRPSSVRVPLDVPV
jgi:hypothetical protein